MLSKPRIKASCRAQSYTRGLSLWHDSAVEGYWFEKEDDNIYRACADVVGSKGTTYRTFVSLDSVGDILDADCECPAFEKFQGLCKHCVALCLEHIDRERQNSNSKPSATVTGGKDHQKILTDFLASCDPSVLRKGAQEIDTTNNRAANPLKQSLVVPSKRTGEGIAGLIRTQGLLEMPSTFALAAASADSLIELEPTLHYDSRSGWSLTLRIGSPTTKYIIKDINKLLHAVANRRRVIYGKKLAFKHEPSAFTHKSNVLMDSIARIINDQNETIARFFGYRPARNAAMRHMDLTNRDVARVIDLFADDSCLFAIGQAEAKSMHVIDGDPFPPVTFEATSDNTGYQLKLSHITGRIESGDTLYLMTRNNLYRCSSEFRQAMLGLCRIVMDPYTKSDDLYIATEDLPAFCATVLPALKTHTKLSAPDELLNLMPDPVTFAFYLDREDPFITCRIEAHYGDDTYNPLKPSPKDLSTFSRNLIAERETLTLVQQYFVELTPDYSCRFEEADDEALHNLLTQGLTRFADVGEIYVSDSLKQLKIHTRPQTTIGVSLKSGVLDLRIDIEGIDAAQISSYLTALKRRKRFFKLHDGSLVDLSQSGEKAKHFDEVSADGDEEDGVTHFLDYLNLDLSLGKGGKLSLPRCQALLVDRELKRAGITTTDEENALADLVRMFDEIEAKPPIPPEPLVSVLRSYQKEGFAWLATLAKIGFGGILADDMGLGKTIQIIALVISLQKSEESKPSLVVCPASLIYNWQAEFARFAPNLSVSLVCGTPEERVARITDSINYDVLVTSYDLLKRDVAQYAEQKFLCEVVDEAHYIKNHNTHAARAVKAIVADCRFALTGTPIENRLGELWSIYDFAVPGLLGTYRHFIEHYEKPIVVNDDNRAREQLQHLIAPFFLRRLKRDVLRDLPEKTENIVVTHLEDNQRTLYNAVAARLKMTLEGQRPEEFATSKIEVLAELTKLRQICCDPHLLFENYKGDAAKLATCRDLAKSAVDGNHKVLVFSQFTTMIARIEADLHKNGIATHVLTGATPKKRRADMVDSFAHDEVPVFLISLKAGGTGLNLTAADIVIHFDPWWNYAAQNQATDRTHRIGQTNEVTVYKLIAENTIEERIVELQDAKRDLADKIIGDESMSVSSLSKADLLELLQDNDS